VPFASQAQRAFMYENHPDIAKRWEAVTPRGKLPEHVIPNANPSSESNESPKPGLKKLPRTPEVKRDFGPLHPSAKSRLKTSHTASTKESDEEDAVEFHPGSRPGKMSLKGSKVLDPLAKRDAAVATTKFNRRS
jgi:hypothetical protein